MFYAKKQGRFKVDTFFTYTRQLVFKALQAFRTETLLREYVCMHIDLFINSSFKVPLRIKYTLQ